ncbi:hypothetical protein SLEP1_g5943 [Rubroshorea leprosula]|uniref:Uncharacterized protein n=1 Tax=Rubroshorea leprosula TaxID=152421 RepID=A0AAV5HZH6_9ROSI|nr:hypothetical protein SLEP1_g5943 [Rubroshorea leprosula]
MGPVWYPPHNYLLFFGAYLLAGTGYQFFVHGVHGIDVCFSLKLPS